MSTTTEPHDSGQRTARPEVVTVRAAGDHLDARAAERLVAPLAAAPAAATFVVDLSAVTHLTLEAASALVQLTRRCRAEDRPLRFTASSAVRRKLALLGLETVVPLQPSS
ncbi:STAS domain-containing protein [Amycolatopsis sp. cmx-4-61]|uniref:STAS domain-containing protein n=1 Tax=Amycolatopsis sp. cmx-4-61 TaxID=2790937 RepID=UPI003979894F